MPVRHYLGNPLKKRILDIITDSLAANSNNSLQLAANKGVVSDKSKQITEHETAHGGK